MGGKSANLGLLAKGALMPPSFGSKPHRLNPFYWTGYWIGAGVAYLGREVKYLDHRASESTGDEKSAWLGRCILAGGLVALGWWLVGVHVPKNSLSAFLISWTLLFLLPRPTPRLPLAGARLLVAGTTGSYLANGVKWIVESRLIANGWEVTVYLIWYAIFMALVCWAIVALFRNTRAATASSGTSNAQLSAKANWRSVPNLTFQDVGGCARAKDELRLFAENRFGKSSSGVVRNGVLLYGPQGTGKNLLAEATAGEYRVNFYPVSCPQLFGTVIGSTTAEIRRVFEWAKDHRPIVLFLDEIDSLGSKKAVQGGEDSGGAGREYNTIVTQLMQAIDQHRNLSGLLIVAATNHLDTLDRTLVREGRFDAKLRLDLPDAGGRSEVLAALLNQVCWDRHDLAQLARRTPGWSPARLKGLVDRAVLLANGSPVEEFHLLAALEASGGHDRPNVESVGWEDVVLPEAVVHDLRTLLRLMAPGEAERLSLPPPSGLILIGAPGTGKTLTARLIASQSRRSFYSISPSDVLAGVTGGSVKRLTEVFARAKEHAPSILFFDEMDGLFPHAQGAIGQHDVQVVEQALIEISALGPEHGVFLIGTTNYIDRVDPRILRGGRFSEKIEIGIPDDAGYRRLIERYVGKARLDAGVTPEILVARVRGIAPADLEATIHAMKRVAMRRMVASSDELPALVLQDLDEALARVQPRF